ncbi:hypothetical protein MP638_006907 [Amoeboaphelidium occidentale]|nr:hypothetical protein MP638_006907 [Amoeboaphelidium occidentale]
MAERLKENCMGSYGGHYIHPSRLGQVSESKTSIDEGNGYYTPRKLQTTTRQDFHAHIMPLSPSSLHSERKRVALTKTKFIQFVRDGLSERIDVKVLRVDGKEVYEFYSSQF